MHLTSNPSSGAEGPPAGMLQVFAAEHMQRIRAASKTTLVPFQVLLSTTLLITFNPINRSLDPKP